MHNIGFLTSECLMSFNLITNWSNILVLNIKPIIVFDAIPWSHHILNLFLHKFKVGAIYFKTLLNHRCPCKDACAYYGHFVCGLVVSLQFHVNGVKQFANVNMEECNNKKPQVDFIYNNCGWLNLGVSWFVSIEISIPSMCCNSFKITQQYLFKYQYAIKTTYKPLQTNGSHVS